MNNHRGTGGPEDPGRKRRIRGSALWLAVIAIVSSLAFWAGRVTFVTPELPLENPDPVLYSVEDGEVGRVMRLLASAVWEAETTIRADASGKITSVAVASGDEVRAGDVVFTVDLRPVVAAEGAIPAFRSLAAGSEGADVLQLEHFLAQIGLYTGSQTGEFGEDLESAVAEWQRGLQVEPDGVVRLGDLVWFPDLPARISPTSLLQVGLSLMGGEDVLEVLADAPVVSIQLDDQQRQLIPTTGRAIVYAGEATWEGEISEVRSDSGLLTLMLAGVGGGPICRDDCGRIPTGPAIGYPVDIVIVPKAEGPLVPVAAITTLPDGSTVVTLEDGSRMAVSILSEGDGLAVVDGVEVGQRILVNGPPGN